MVRLFGFSTLIVLSALALSASAADNLLPGDEFLVETYPESFDDAAAYYDVEYQEQTEPSHAQADDASDADADDSCGCCHDGFWTRAQLTGDWGGHRTSLAAHGIVWNGQLTQFHQGVVDGGNEQTFKYGGKLDQFVAFDFGKMGLCQHLTGIMHTETRFGETVIADAAPLAPVNTNMLYPKLGQNDTAITGLMFQLALTDDLSLAFGRINALDLWTMVYPQTGRGVDGFMNTSMILPLTLARTFPLVTNGAGLLKKQDGKIQGGLMVYDTKSYPTSSGFENMFDNGANVLGLWRVFTQCGGRPGSHAILGTWSSGDFTSLDPTGWAIVPGQGIVAPQASGAWSVQYIIEQQLWADACNPQRNIGLLSQWGYADAQTSPYEFVANVAFQAQGLCCNRPQDTMGAGYFYTGLSEDAKALLNPTIPVNDLQGVEVYYNAAVTPWFHLTADLQVIEPALQTNDTAVVFGIRGKISL